MQKIFTEIKTKKRDDPIKLFRFFVNSQGFTLAELITSIAIIGILATVGMHNIKSGPMTPTPKKYYMI